MRSLGYSTKLYNSIIELFSDNGSRALTADDVYRAVCASGETVNRTSVYRNLDKLVAEGQLLKYVTDDGKRASYVFKGGDDSCVEHFHLQCTECGRVIHLDCGSMDEFIRHVSDEHGFDMSCGSSILYGKCRDCRNKTK